MSGPGPGLGSKLQRQVGRQARKTWRKAKPRLPGPVRRTVQPMATGVVRASRRSRAGEKTLGTGLLRDRAWIPRPVTDRARALARKNRYR